MPGAAELVAFVATSDPERARRFCADTLGIRPEARTRSHRSSMRAGPPCGEHAAARPARLVPPPALATNDLNRFATLTNWAIAFVGRGGQERAITGTTNVGADRHRPTDGGPT